MVEQFIFAYKQDLGKNFITKARKLVFDYIKTCRIKDNTHGSCRTNRLGKICVSDMTDKD